MLKELNSIAAGLLGLHGFPTKAWSAPAQGAASGRGAAAIRGRKGNAVRKTAARAGRTGAATRACG